MNEFLPPLIPGQRCVIVAGCPENIGLIVEVVRHLGASRGYEDGYEIMTLSGRNFRQLWRGTQLIQGSTMFAYTERYKLRPLVEPGAEEEVQRKDVPLPGSKALSS